MPDNYAFFTHISCHFTDCRGEPWISPEHIRKAFYTTGESLWNMSIFRQSKFLNGQEKQSGDSEVEPGLEKGYDFPGSSL